VLPDARCKQIIEEVTVPLMREGRREAAVTSGVEALLAATKSEYTGTGRTQLDHQGLPIPLPPPVSSCWATVGSPHSSHQNTGGESPLG
jgi:uncharacterized membrane protein YgcG